MVQYSDQCSDEVWEVKLPALNEVWEPLVVHDRVADDGGVCDAGTCCDAVPDVRAVILEQVDRPALTPLEKVCWAANFGSAEVHGAEDALIAPICDLADLASRE